MVKRIIAFIIMNMMATTLVFAEHTKASLNNDLSRILNAYSNITDQARNKSNQCSMVKTNKLIKKIDARIALAQNSNESLDESINKEINRYYKLRSFQVKMTKKILRWNRRITRAYNNVKKSNPELTRSEFVSELRASITKTRTIERVESIKASLIEAGSMVNYLTDMKDKLLNCNAEKALSQDKGFDIGWLWVILFVGLPVITLLTSLFALIFGAFWWALGLFAYTVVGLLVLFIWGNVARVNPQGDDEEELNLL